jgi:conjugative relaxase-like TrwC/TraI family protein
LYTLNWVSTIRGEVQSKGAKRYYASADYYSEGQEIVGSWGGRAARMLGLDGIVDKESFDRLCDNLSPHDGKQLTVRTRSDRTVGYDFTFSVPKSVSLLYALTGDREILDAFRSAVDETMRNIESEMKTRVRKGGKDEDRLTGNMVWAEFIHTTSRPVDGVPDPQLHAHCFTFNTTWDDQERRWKAGQFRGLKADAPYFQAAFRVRLANRLQELGFGVVRKRDDFEIAGIDSAALLKRFSRRTDVIEAVAAERGISDPDRKGELGAETRESKNHEMSWNQLRQEWDSRLTDSERQVLAATHRREAPYAQPILGEGQAVDHALEHCFVREPVVSERKLLTEALKRGLGSITVEGVQGELARRPLIRGEHEGVAKVTTKEMKAAEGALVAFARLGRGRFRPLGNPDRPCTHAWLNDEQKAAVRHVLGSRDPVTLLRGAAGTGKTTLEREIGAALAEANVPVVAIAQSTGAVDELREEAGFGEAVTVAHFLKDTRMQASVRGGLVLIDEASQLGTRDMLRLFDIARDAGARIALVGDKRQHRSVSAGEPLRLLEERAGLPVAEVTQIVRQVPAAYRLAAQAASDGRTAEAFAALDQLGWIREIPHAGRYWVLAQGYLSTIQEKDKKGQPKTALVVSPTHAEGERITNFIRNALKADGKLGEERTLATWVSARLTDPEKGDAANYEPGDMLQFHQNAPGQKKGSRLIVDAGQTLPLPYAERYEVYRPSQLTLAVKDRVRITANGWTKDGKHRLKNGMLLTVQGFTPQGDPIVDKGWVIARDFGHLAHGYAVTSHASQGKTVSKVFIGLSSQSFPAANQRSFYVPVTRGKEQAVIFTDSKEELLKAVQRPDQPISATEFAESRRRKPAVRQRLHKHLAFMRRLATFARSHEPASPEYHRTPPSLDREKDYVR